MTGGNITGQVKALSMIVAIEGLIPDRRAGSTQKKSVTPPTHPGIYRAAWLRKQPGETIDPHPDPALAQEDDEPARPGVAWDLAEPEPTPGSAGDVPPPDPIFDPSQSAFANRFKPLATTPSSPHARVPASAPDKRIPSAIEKNPSTWRLRL